jgi:BA14K-like protein
MIDVDWRCVGTASAYVASLWSRRPQLKPLAAYMEKRMSRLSIVGATALLLALAVGTPTFAVELRGVNGHGGGAMHVGSGGAQAKRRLRGIDEASARYCAERYAYYNPVSGKYMGDDGEWRPCR